MAWLEPKVNWSGTTDADGNYIGDRFDYRDFNRIKNNLEYLRTLVIKIYSDEFVINELGADRTPSNYFYADEINKLEKNLVTINEKSLNNEYGTAPVYIPNGSTMDFIELNRLENATLDLYNKLKNVYENRRKFVWNFGVKGGF